MSSPLLTLHTFVFCCFFFFNDTATTEIYTLSLHDALPIYEVRLHRRLHRQRHHSRMVSLPRSEEHTSELQSPNNLVCRLLLEKKQVRRRPASWVDHSSMLAIHGLEADRRGASPVAV